MTSERIYVGSYTSQPGAGDGIGFGPLDGIELVVTTADPSFLVRSADGRFLYATGEVHGGRVSAFAVQADGGLEFVNEQPSGGADPCHLDIDPSGRYLLSANYTSGAVAIHPLQDDGSARRPSSCSAPGPDRTLSARRGRTPTRSRSTRPVRTCSTSTSARTPSTRPR